MIRVLDAKSGALLNIIDTKNLIVNGTKEVLTELICNADTAYNQLWAIGTGDGTNAPSILDTDLKGTKTKKKKYDSRTYDAVTGEIEMQMILGPIEGNILSTGEYFTEAGLFTRGDNDDPEDPGLADVTMMSRQIHAPIHKDNSITLEYTWRLQIAIA